MEIFLDSAKEDEIKSISEIPFISGITTNPTLISKEGVRVERLIEIVKKLNLKIFVQTLGEKKDEIFKEGRNYFSLYPEGLILKIPFSLEGLKAIPLFKKNGIPVAVTAIFSLPQIAVSIPLNPDYVIPYIDRIGRFGGDGIKIVKEAKELIQRQGANTKILSASFRSVKQLEEAITAGTHCLTIPMKVLKEILSNPLTIKAIKDFKSDWFSMSERNQN